LTVRCGIQLGQNLVRTVVSDNFRSQRRLKHLCVTFDFRVLTLQFVEGANNAAAKRCIPFQKILIEYARRR
jgi:hypothetical protein